MKIVALACGLFILCALNLGCQKSSFLATKAAPTATAESAPGKESPAQPQPETEDDSTDSQQPPVATEPAPSGLYLRDVKSLSFQIKDRNLLAKALHQMNGKAPEKIHFAFAHGQLIEASQIPKTIENMELVCALYSNHNQLPPEGLKLESSKISEKYSMTTAKTFLRQTSITLQNESETLTILCQRKGFALLKELQKTFAEVAIISGK